MAFFYQQTLAKSASLTGTSLHTGSQVSLRLRPAPVDHGIKFKRMDLPDEPTIDAKIEHVKFVERATT
ncbi:MAG TPA: UDP-3-O-acyl-N-acetylglucosamine deacetylase, partial [Chthoniobacterales bacterium]|nr:UDP-3-O-acyl-N-acetylglucosamine deacetylase [Chthoniobacterales bacterium]